MITRSDACFMILAVILGSVSAFHCPLNQACICQSYRDREIEINCLMKNDSEFIVNIQLDESIKDHSINYHLKIQIKCINSPDWSDFHLNVTALTKNENIKLLKFEMCNLPTNNSLGEIARLLGATDVEKLIFRSDKNMNSALVKHHLNDFENLKYLNLRVNNLFYVDKDLLAGVVNLTELNLNVNNLSLVTEFFNYTPGLELLNLDNNGLRSIELSTFDNLKNLMFLSLKNNHLTELQPGIFNELVALKSLTLYENDMVKLPKDIFTKLENLITIELSNNNFTYLPRNLLRNNTNLQYVYLSHNKGNMTTLPNEFFANLTELKELILNENGFVTLPEDLFWGCTSLTSITMEQNYLQTLPKHIFRDLKELKKLDLNSNDLATLPDDIFLNTYQLATIDLSKNRITSISNRLFKRLYALEELNMEENRLMTISYYGFSNLHNLKIAKFSRNYLTLEDSQDKNQNETVSSGNWTPFYQCDSLEKLYLANNNISKIFIDWAFLPLQKLDLKYNNIPHITIGDVLFKSNIEIDLTHNRIEHIFLHGRIKHPEDIHMKILVDNNPLHCDCQLYDLLRHIEGRMNPRIQNYFDIRPENLTCQSPKELKNVHVTNLRSKSLTCVANYTECPEMCNCLERPEDNAFIIDCSQRNLTSVPSDIEKPPNHFRFELNFSGNRLTRMPDLKAMKLESVKNLILSHNNIIEISPDGLSRTIQVLKLHNNNVSRIHPDVLKFLKNSTNLTRLTLHENPWECDCDAKEFQSFIRNATRFVTIPDLLNVKCVGTNISVLETNDFCAVDTTMIISFGIPICLILFLIGFIGLLNYKFLIVFLNGFLIGIIGTLYYKFLIVFLIGILTCLFGLLYYKYQRQIKMWLFAHQWCLWFVTEEELDKEKLYDAFVSYSHKDHEFVENELVSKLENGSTPFKLCLHYRDWLAGEWIPANIASSVENSRRTIIVLSPNFLESIWGRMEFRAAHSQALSEGRARVILILFGDIGPIDNLDPELKAYISMNTYIKWGDPWFWDRLKYALPHLPKLARHSAAGNKIFENHQLCNRTNGDRKELAYQFPLVHCG